MLHHCQDNVISHYHYPDSILIRDNRFIIIIAQHYYQVHDQYTHIATYLPLSLLTVLTIDPESARLCTFNTPFGRYKFKRLLFGLSSAPDVFQKVMSEMFEDIEGVEVVVDDILVWGTTEEQHDARLMQVLERA